MTAAKLESALRTWDSEIVAAYIGQMEGDQACTRTSFDITLQRVHARDLILVVADTAVRSSDLLGVSMATFDSLRMRDAALSVVIERYLAVLPGPDQRDGDNRLAERILVGLILRREPDHHARLTRQTVVLPTAVCAALNAEVGRVLCGIDLNGSSGHLATDLRSSLVEGIIATWMHQRAEAFEIALGRDRTHHGWSYHRRRSCGAC
jgi:hypothetical protein